MSAASHATKAGTRLMINTSPEPFTNWTASITEDVAVIGGLWAALNYPIAFIAFLVLFIIFMIWFLPKIWRGIKLLFRKIGEWLGIVEKAEPSSDVTESQATEADGDALEKLSKLKSLLDDGAITQDEFEHQKKHLLELSLNSTPSST